MCKLLKIKLNTPANVHPPVVCFVSFCIVSCLRVTQLIQGRPLSRAAAAAAATAYVAS